MWISFGLTSLRSQYFFKSSTLRKSSSPLLDYFYFFIFHAFLFLTLFVYLLLKSLNVHLFFCLKKKIISRFSISCKPFVVQQIDLVRWNSDAFWRTCLNNDRNRKECRRHHHKDLVCANYSQQVPTTMHFLHASC